MMIVRGGKDENRRAGLFVGRHRGAESELASTPHSLK